MTGFKIYKLVGRGVAKAVTNNSANKYVNTILLRLEVGIIYAKQRLLYGVSVAGKPSL
jgi:hypothetical protein